MGPNLRAIVVIAALTMTLPTAEPAFSQKPDGILSVHQYDNPPSLSIHEEVTYATDVPMLGIFNNLARPAPSRG